MWDGHHSFGDNLDCFILGNPLLPQSGGWTVHGCVVPNGSVSLRIRSIWTFTYNAHGIWGLRKGWLVLQILEGHKVQISGVWTASRFWPTLGWPPLIPCPTAGPGWGKALRRHGWNVIGLWTQITLKCFVSQVMTSSHQERVDGHTCHWQWAPTSPL